jgi:hypothetical protein
VLFDGTELEVLEQAQWRLEDAATGRIRIVATMRGWAGGDAIQSAPHRAARYDTGPEYVRAVWSTTGSVSPALQAVLEWLKDPLRRPRPRPDLAGYQTGKDAESYFAASPASRAAIGRPGVIKAWHPANGGVI